MSLKHFHVIFIVISMLLFVGVAVWAFRFSREQSFEITAIGVGCSVLAAALFVYGISFIRKARNLIT